MGDVPHHEPGQAGESRRLGAGRPDASRARLAQRDEGGDELGRREQDAGEDRRRRGQGARASASRAGSGAPRDGWDEEGDEEPRAEEQRSRADRLRRAGEEEEADREGEKGRGRRAGAGEVRLRREEDERQRRGGHHRRGVAEVGHEVGAEGEAEPGHERPDGITPQAAGVEKDERARQRQRREHERLEGRERGERGERDREGVEGPGAVRGEERRPGEGRAVPGGHLSTVPRAPDLRAQRQVERRAVPGGEEAPLAPGRGIGEERGGGEHQDQEAVAPPGRHGRDRRRSTAARQPE